MAIASPTAAPEKREGRPNLVICRVCARNGDGFNSTLGVKKKRKGKAAQLQLPPQFRLAEKRPVEKEEQRKVCEKAFASAQHTLVAISSRNTPPRIAF